MLAGKLPRGVLSVSLTTRPIGKAAYGSSMDDRGNRRDRGRPSSGSRGGYGGSRGGSRGGMRDSWSAERPRGGRSSALEFEGGGRWSGEGRSASADRAFPSGQGRAGSEGRSYQESRSSQASGRSTKLVSDSWQAEWDKIKFSR